MELTEEELEVMRGEGMCEECGVWGEYYEFHWHAEVADSGTRSEAADRLIEYFGL